MHLSYARSSLTVCTCRCLHTRVSSSLPFFSPSLPPLSSPVVSSPLLLSSLSPLVGPRSDERPRQHRSAAPLDGVHGGGGEVGSERRREREDQSTRLGCDWRGRRQCARAGRGTNFSESEDEQRYARTKEDGDVMRCDAVRCTSHREENRLTSDSPAPPVSLLCPALPCPVCLSRLRSLLSPGGVRIGAIPMKRTGGGFVAPNLLTGGGGGGATTSASSGAGAGAAYTGRSKSPYREDEEDDRFLRHSSSTRRNYTRAGRP